MAIAHQARPPANTAEPRVTTAAGPKRRIRRPAIRNEQSGTMIGPGAMARPACSADHPQSLCSQTVMDSSIAPKDAANRAMTDEEPEKLRTRNKAGGTSGLPDVRQCATKKPSSKAEAARAVTVPGDPHPQVFPCTSPNVPAPTPPVTRTAPSASGRRTG